jgi:hypothetical protein
VAPLHPLIVRIRKAQRRLSNEQVMRLPYSDLVRYCDSLLNSESACSILASCFEKEERQGQGGVRKALNGKPDEPVLAHVNRRPYRLRGFEGEHGRFTPYG